MQWTLYLKFYLKLLFFFNACHLCNFCINIFTFSFSKTIHQKKIKRPITQIWHYQNEQENWGCLQKRTYFHFLAATSFDFRNAKHSYKKTHLINSCTLSWKGSFEDEEEKKGHFPTQVWPPLLHNYIFQVESIVLFL